jgi:hypothetical protein
MTTFYESVTEGVEITMTIKFLVAPGVVEYDDPCTDLRYRLYKVIGSSVQPEIGNISVKEERRIIKENGQSVPLGNVSTPELSEEDSGLHL